MNVLLYDGDDDGGDLREIPCVEAQDMGKLCAVDGDGMEAAQTTQATPAFQGVLRVLEVLVGLGSQETQANQEIQRNRVVLERPEVLVCQVFQVSLEIPGSLGVQEVLEILGSLELRVDPAALVVPVVPELLGDQWDPYPPSHPCLLYHPSGHRHLYHPYRQDVQVFRSYLRNSIVSY